MHGWIVHSKIYNVHLEQFHKFIKVNLHFAHTLNLDFMLRQATLIFFFKKKKILDVLFISESPKHTDRGSTLSLFLCNVQHLSEAKKAQQSLEGTYKQLDNVSFSLWQVVMETLLWWCVSLCLWACRWTTRSDCVWWVYIPVKGLRYVSLWRKCCLWGECSFVSIVSGQCGVVSGDWKWLFTDRFCGHCVWSGEGQECKQTHTFKYSWSSWYFPVNNEQIFYTFKGIVHPKWKFCH